MALDIRRVNIKYEGKLTYYQDNHGKRGQKYRYHSSRGEWLAFLIPTTNATQTILLQIRYKQVCRPACNQQIACLPPDGDSRTYFEINRTTALKGLLLVEELLL
jgi:hypothetical protein